MKYNEDLIEQVKESILKLKGNPDAEILFNNFVAIREDSVRSLTEPDSIKDPKVMSYYASQIDLLDAILDPIREVYNETF